MKAIKETNLAFDQQTAFYKGKVRDVYSIADQYVVMLATDRLSAFDVVLPRAIPHKGHVLNKIAEKFLGATRDILPNWVITVPDPNVTIGYKCEPFKVEIVVRGYLSGHAWRTYRDGGRELCGVALPEGLSENDPLPAPIITPTTKADVGHDEDISKGNIIARGIVDQKDYEELERYALALYQRGSEMAKERGLILVDTKYEFGKRDDQIYLMDEIHTPDSSRYFYADGYELRQQKGEPQKQLSKEFVRQWLIEHGFQGKEGQQVPIMTDEIVNSISERYIELFEQLTGEKFHYQPVENVLERIEKSVKAALAKIG